MGPVDDTVLLNPSPATSLNSATAMAGRFHNEPNNFFPGGSSRVIGASFGIDFAADLLTGTIGR